MRWLGLVIVLSLAPLIGCSGSQQAETEVDGPRQVRFENEAWTGDFDQMLERRLIRVLVPYSRTLYFNDKGQERGITAELVRGFEAYLNKKHARQLAQRPLTIYMIPVTRDALITDLVGGLGDIAAGNLTETPGRLELVDFVAPRDRKPTREVVVTGPGSPAITSLDDLAGQRVHVRRTSSYYESLTALNERLKGKGASPIKIAFVPDALEDEDLMEMLNAGLLGLIVVNDSMARAWAQVLPEIEVTDVAVAEGGYSGWAIRKGSPGLATAITDFYDTSARPRGVVEYLMAQYQRRIPQIANNTATADWRRFEEMLGLFEKYGEQYDFDPLMLAAQGYQESRLRQDARSPSGAIGVMQVTPATGAEMDVGDITLLDPNIHAGVKYLDHLMATYFPDATFGEPDRTLFALASYNAGPSRIAGLRKEAESRGLDPNRWFDNVEVVVAERVGIETTTYVRNILKYDTAYALQLDVQEEQRKARGEVGSTL